MGLRIEENTDGFEGLGGSGDGYNLIDRKTGAVIGAVFMQGSICERAPSGDPCHAEAAYWAAAVNAARAQGFSRELLETLAEGSPATLLPGSQSGVALLDRVSRLLFLLLQYPEREVVREEVAGVLAAVMTDMGDRLLQEMKVDHG